MKVLGISCSPRRDGNTDILVKEALSAAQEAGAEVEFVSLAGKDIYPCDACEICRETGRCKINDDMQPIYDQLLEADGIIIGSPVYFWSICAQAKTLVDRTYALAGAHRALLEGRGHGPAQQGLRDKVGGAIVVTRRAGASSALTQLRSFLRIHRMVEGGGAMAYAHRPGDVWQDEQGVKEARLTGRAVARKIKQISPATAQPG